MTRQVKFFPFFVIHYLKCELYAFLLLLVDNYHKKEKEE
jgi:hypothetical protein